MLTTLSKKVPVQKDSLVSMYFNLYGTKYLPYYGQGLPIITKFNFYEMENGKKIALIKGW